MRSLDTMRRISQSKDQTIAIKRYENEQPKVMEVLIALVATAILGGIAWICILELMVRPEILEIIAVSGGVVTLVVLVVLFANAIWAKGS